eukprot:CFRG6338T1
MHKWADDEYLCDAVGRDTEVTVALTPSGRADAVHLNTEDNVEYFVQPEERRMCLDDVLTQMRSRTGKEKSISVDGVDEIEDTVLYVQTQNDNLSSEFKNLSMDIEPDIDWATKALGKAPDAVNLWIGTDLSTSSLHKDHYENLYVVVQGEKHFTLLPPTDVPYLHTKRYPTAKYKWNEDTSMWSIQPQPEHSAVPWIPVDPNAPDLDRFPQFGHASPVRCTVRPGEMLYLPAMWYHQVSQTCSDGDPVIAVNYWYDMTFELKYCYWRMLESISEMEDVDTVKSGAFIEDEDHSFCDCDKCTDIRN